MVRARVRKRPPNRSRRVSRSTERTVRPSVLDRLIDHEPKLAEDPSISFSESARRYRQSVLRDLEWLLNTRRSIAPVPELCAEVRRSAFHFGLPDVSSISGESEAGRRKLLRDVEECIEIFEPRLTDVRVTPVEDPSQAHRRVRFVIEGTLLMEPNPERVVFDTVLDLASGEVEVAGAV